MIPFSILVMGRVNHPWARGLILNRKTKGLKSEKDYHFFYVLPLYMLIHIPEYIGVIRRGLKVTARPAGQNCGSGSVMRRIRIQYGAHSNPQTDQFQYEPSDKDLVGSG